MTGNKKIISSLDASMKKKITLEDHYCIQAEGKGIVPTLTKKNQQKTFLMFIVFHIWIITLLV